MALIDKINIVFTERGKKKQVLLSWLLSDSAMWAFDANPFMVIDDQLSTKIKGTLFNGRDVKPQLIAKYPYLRTVLDEAEEDLHVDVTTEDETEAPEHQIEDTPEKVLDEVLSEEMTLETIEATEDIEVIKEYLSGKGVKYDKRKKSLEYFQELAIKSI